MPNYSVRITDLALDDLAELSAFYADLVDEESAQRFEDDADKTIKGLAVLALRNPYFDKAHNLRRINLHRHNVAVIYTVKDDVYEVVAIAAFRSLQNPRTYRSITEQRID